MKKSDLIKIIKEEVENTLQESDYDFDMLKDDDVLKVGDVVRKQIVPAIKSMSLHSGPAALAHIAVITNIDAIHLTYQSSFLSPLSLRIILSYFNCLNNVCCWKVDNIIVYPANVSS